MTIDTKRNVLKSAIRIERLMGHKVKAHIGQAWGVGKSESEARANCEVMIVDMLENYHGPKIEVRDGYLIVSQVESSESGWYSIKRLSDLQDGQHIYPLCCMSPKGLKAAIDSHLGQYKQDAANVPVVAEDPRETGNMTADSERG